MFRFSRVSLYVVLLEGVFLLATRAAFGASYFAHNESMVEVSRVLAHSVGPSDYFGGTCQCPRLDDSGLSDSKEGESKILLLDVGKLEFYQGRYRKAIQTLQQVSPNYERRLVADFFLGASYLCLNDGIHAAQYWRENTLAWNAFRGIYECQRTGQAQRATTLYDLALTIQPEIAAGWQQMWAEPALAHYLAAATVARERGLLDVELHWLQLGLAKFTSSLASYRLGEFYERAGDFVRAKEYYAQALALSAPDDPTMYQYYVRASFAIGDWTDGVAAARKLLIEMKPDSEWEWRIIAALTHQYLNPDLCHHMEGLLREVKHPSSAGIAAMIGNIRSWCAAE